MRLTMKERKAVTKGWQVSIGEQEKRTIRCGGLLTSFAMPPRPALGRAKPDPHFRCGGLLASLPMPPRPALGRAEPDPRFRFC